ncbi:hypothetical protein NEIG_02317 [Nematocida sp. ERTm5]|nr:hypothetical protein NEIG_02317 [Nematocida sp. ERTm5]
MKIYNTLCIIFCIINIKCTGLAGLADKAAGLAANTPTGMAIGAGLSAVGLETNTNQANMPNMPNQPGMPNTQPGISNPGASMPGMPNTQPGMPGMPNPQPGMPGVPNQPGMPSSPSTSDMSNPSTSSHTAW